MSDEEETWLAVAFYVVALIAGAYAFYQLYEALS